ncbi:MAG TPA: hypothetical protein VGS58_12985 [Candidatus Sulfopaludibacter sp.]|nr:hypothetical protein [Candidatus Sulfopaludibacter sp.]
MAHVLEVGKLYVAGKTRWAPGAEYAYRAGQHQLLIIQDGLTRKEVDGIARGRAEFALYVSAPALFFLYRFEGFGPWSDAPFSRHLEREADREPVFEVADAMGALLSVIAVEATTGIVKALRGIGLAHDFSVALHAGITEQDAAGWPGGTAYDAAVRAAYARYPYSSAMAADAIARCRADER